MTVRPDHIQGRSDGGVRSRADAGGDGCKGWSKLLSGLDADVPEDRPTARSGTVFSVLNEVGLVEQLARSRLEEVLPDGLLLPHFVVLHHLVEHPDGRSMSKLAEAFQVSRATMTNTVRRLSDRALVAVSTDPADGRGRLVRPTDAGRAMRELAAAKIAPMIDELAARAGGATFDSLLPHLRRLREALHGAAEGETLRSGRFCVSEEPGAPL